MNVGVVGSTMATGPVTVAVSDAVAALDGWSQSRSRRSTIFNMLEYMGAWEWYDRQIKLTMAKHEAEKKKELAPKTAASYVLSEKLKTPGKSIKGIGRLVSEEGRKCPRCVRKLSVWTPLGFVCWFSPTVESSEYLSHIRATLFSLCCTALPPCLAVKKPAKHRSTAVTIDNRWVVPYNPYLTRRYQCHINVEVCSSIKVIKYLYKYIYEGRLSPLSLHSSLDSDRPAQAPTERPCR